MIANPIDKLPAIMNPHSLQTYTRLGNFNYDKYTDRQTTNDSDLIELGPYELDQGAVY